MWQYLGICSLSSPASALLRESGLLCHSVAGGHCLLVLLGNVSEYCICWGSWGGGMVFAKKKKKQLWLIYYFVAMGLSVNSS